MKEEPKSSLNDYSNPFPKRLCWKPILLEQAEELCCGACEECNGLIKEAKQKGVKILLIETKTKHLRINS